MQIVLGADGPVYSLYESGYYFDLIFCLKRQQFSTFLLKLDLITKKLEMYRFFELPTIYFMICHTYLVYLSVLRIWIRFTKDRVLNLIWYLPEEGANSEPMPDWMRDL